MRLVPALCLALASAANGFPLPDRQGTPVESPVGQLRLALLDLGVKVNPADAPYVRYLSFAWPPPGVSRMDFRRTFRQEINKRNGGDNVLPEIEVDGPNGTVATSHECTLVRINVSDVVNWTRTAWVLVADRDYLFREAPFGLLPHREAQFGRLVTGVEQNERTLAAGFILNAAQLFRDMIDLDRSQTGHDLLYAYERHPDADGGHVEFIQVGAGPPHPGPTPPMAKSKPWPGGVWSVDGKYHPPGEFIYIDDNEKAAALKAREAWRAAKTAYDAAPHGPPVFIVKRPISVKDAGKGRADFPATLDEFQKRWGGRGRDEKLKTFLFDPAVGGIALAADSDPLRGSTVAAGGDRVIRIDGTDFGWLGTTFDSFESVDGNDQIERDQWLNITKGVIKFDGGEALASMPLGGQAEFLFNEKKQSVAIANPKLAKHLETKSADPRHPEVRVGRCQACHGSGSGYNPFVEQLAESRARGIKFQVYPEDAAQFRSFYEGWQRKVKRWRLPYDEYLEATTLDTLTGKPWTGTQAWAATMKAGDAFDLPVDISEIAREFGYDVETLRQRILGPNEKYGPVDTRLNQIAVGKLVPRPTYQKNVAGKLATWLDLVEPPKEKIKELLTEQFLADAYRRFGYKPEK